MKFLFTLSVHVVCQQQVYLSGTKIEILTSYRNRYLCLCHSLTGAITTESKTVIYRTPRINYEKRNTTKMGTRCQRHVINCYTSAQNMRPILKSYSEDSQKASNVLRERVFFIFVNASTSHEDDARRYSEINEKMCVTLRCCSQLVFKRMQKVLLKSIIVSCTDASSGCTT